MVIVRSSGKLSGDPEFMEWIQARFPERQAHAEEIDAMVADVAALAAAVRNEGRTRAERELRHKFDMEARSHENALRWLPAAAYIPEEMVRWIFPNNRNARVVIPAELTEGESIRAERHIYDSADPVVNARIYFQMFSTNEPVIEETQPGMVPVFTRSTFGGSAYAGIVPEAQARRGRQQGAYLPDYI